jgi:hypothetical protein
LLFAGKEGDQVMGNQSFADPTAKSFLEQARLFRVGERVELVYSPGIPGTVTGQR